MSADCARSWISWPEASAESQIRVALRERAADALGVDVQMVGVVVSERRAHVGPVVAQHRRELLLGGDHAARSLRPIRSSSAPKRSTGSRSAMSGLLGVLITAGGTEAAAGGGDLRQLAVLCGELRRGCDLDLLHVPQRALRERREPAQRFDLHVEHVNANGPLLGRGEHVQQAAAHRELPALLHLVDAFIARAHELCGALLQIQQLADAQRERVRAKLRVGHLLRQRHRADHHDRLALCGLVAARARLAASSESSAATRRPTRCGGGARCDS